MRAVSRKPKWVLAAAMTPGSISTVLIALSA